MTSCGQARDAQGSQLTCDRGRINPKLPHYWCLPPWFLIDISFTENFLFQNTHESDKSTFPKSSTDLGKHFQWKYQIFSSIKIKGRGKHRFRMKTFACWRAWANNVCFVCKKKAIHLHIYISDDFVFTPSVTVSTSIKNNNFPYHFSELNLFFTAVF